ncbi:MAG: hypothetical protein ACYTG0_14520 [Planctomycetota bacterium]
MSHDSHQPDPLGRIADSFVERYRNDERPSIEEYVDEYPELAEQIREVISALVMMEEAKPAVGGDTAPLAGSDGKTQAEAPRKLGDFRMLRELGRGASGSSLVSSPNSPSKRSRDAEHSNGRPLHVTDSGTSPFLPGLWWIGDLCAQLSIWMPSSRLAA